MFAYLRFVGICVHTNPEKKSESNIKSLYMYW
jgi:hypothetical protein